jgi:hypothetical protein
MSETAAGIACAAEPGEGQFDAVIEQLQKRIAFARVATMLGVHISTVHRLRLAGRLRGCFRIGSRWFATPASIEAMLTTSGGDRPAPRHATRSESDRRKASEAARERCRALGA